MHDLTHSFWGMACLAIFLFSYVLVIFEDKLHLRKSKPVLVAAGLIWVIIGIAFAKLGISKEAEEASTHLFFEYGELLLFLLVAITYVNTLEERRVFQVLQAKLGEYGFTYKQLFWITGGIAFMLSPVLDNLTTALILGALVMAVGKDSPRFVAAACVSIVVAANAGGAFSPFGDITTLMVWQKGKVLFFEFLALFLPSLVNWLVPALIMSFAIPKGKPAPVKETFTLKPGAIGVIVLFAATIVTAVSFRNFLGLQPALGMMLGLGYLQLLAYYLQRQGSRRGKAEMVLDSFKQIERVEWDTLLFFFGVIFAVGGLGVMGYLAMANEFLYGAYGATTANIVVGLLSSIVDNIPLLFAVLTMDPQMSHVEWLLLTLATGVGGSLLSVGSAAGVALMGLAGKNYTFMSHLKWSWAVLLGYIASIGVHMLVNGI
ncbi:MAG: sodium:proton antiporter NhaD [Aestuariivirga sp.]